MSFLSPFHRPVVHVRVHENPFPAGGDKTRLALYRVSNRHYGLPFKPAPFRYSSAIKKDVRSHLSWLTALFVVIKIWRVDGVTEGPRIERHIARPLALLVLLLTMCITAISLGFLWIELQNISSPVPIQYEENGLSPAVLAVLNGNVATAGATATAIIGVRVLRFSEPFETTAGWVACHLGPVVVALVINLALIRGWFGWDTAAIKAMIAPWALIISLTATGITAGLSTLRWTAIEEIQRQKPLAREVADWVLRRKVV